MPKLTQSNFTEIVISWIKEHGQVDASADKELTETTDLIATGLLDSFGFVDLFLFLEAQSGRKIDLTDADPTEFATVGGLYRIVTSQDEVLADAGVL